MTVERGGKIFTVAYETETDAEGVIDLHPDPRKPPLLLWSKTECRFIKEQRPKMENTKA